ncbi:hypothetical protein JR316_0011354 [Psilocybe cubensis]|uniref:Uncharacterized protein n=1 Tax=Psilocybe cubensis TaxID=181762 RepID=A0ACB8GJ88_PSICU|nr:hypothetical protein JR316_0011354 [Psilocybe cubensis]KAH9475795.1 hypothetical protein JR316_0011354 [Psilocybe cubensis]
MVQTGPTVNILTPSDTIPSIAENLNISSLASSPLSMPNLPTALSMTSSLGQNFSYTSNISTNLPPETIQITFTTSNSLQSTTESSGQATPSSSHSSISRPSAEVAGSLSSKSFTKACFCILLGNTTIFETISLIPVSSIGLALAPNHNARFSGYPTMPTQTYTTMNQRSASSPETTPSTKGTVSKNEQRLFVDLGIAASIFAVSIILLSIFLSRQRHWHRLKRGVISTRAISLY